MRYLTKSASGVYEATDSIPTIPGFVFKKLNPNDLRKRVIWEGRCFTLFGKIQREQNFSSLLKSIVRIVESVFRSRPEVKEKTRFQVFIREERDLAKLQKEIHRLSENRKIPALIAPHTIARIEQLTNPGIALIADHLRKKSNLKNLIVCDTLEILQQKLKEIENTPEDARFSFIVSTHQFEISPFKREPNEQHKMAICVEKKNQHLHVVVLDSSPSESSMNPDHINFDISLFTSKELIFSYLMEIGLNPTKTFFYNSKIGRRFGPNGGCAIFALRDAVNFLKNPHFFKQMQIDQGDKLDLTWGTICGIKQLPPEYMKGTQSVTALDCFIQTFKEKLNLDPLLKSLEKHKAELLSIKDRKTSAYHNRYIDDRMEKYHRILIKILHDRSDSEINQIIAGASQPN